MQGQLAHSSTCMVYEKMVQAREEHSSHCLTHQNGGYKLGTSRVQTVVVIIYERLDYTELGRFVLGVSSSI